MVWLWCMRNAKLTTSSMTLMYFEIKWSLNQQPVMKSHSLILIKFLKSYRGMVYCPMLSQVISYNTVWGQFIPSCMHVLYLVGARVGADYKGMITITIMITPWLPRVIIITITVKESWLRLWLQNHDYCYDYDYMQQWNVFKTSLWSVDRNISKLEKDFVITYQLSLLLFN